MTDIVRIGTLLRPVLELIRTGGRPLLPILVALATLLAPKAHASAAEPKPGEAATAAPKADAEETGWQSLFRAMAADYEIGTVEKAPRKFTLRAAPVLRWSQPVRGGDDGAVYVWLDQGRPAVIGSIFAWPLPDGVRVVAHEMHALTLAPMCAVYQGKQVWSVEEPALGMKRIPEAPAPAASAPQRLAQIRTLGREFAATSIDRDNREWELRLLGHPLYRYEVREHPELLDGAILAFVQGTDPEILLILEARREGDQPYWQYALARFSDLKLIVKRHDLEVWRVPNSTYDDRKAPYFVRNVDRRKLADAGDGQSKAKE